MQHIAFIMDGNRRFAQRLSQIASFGHQKWGETIEKVIGYCLDASIPYVSMWALSKENIQQRSSEEIAFIYSLLREKLPELTKIFLQKGIVLRTVWDMSLLPEDIQLQLKAASEQTKAWTNMTYILAVAYSGQDEIIRWIKKMIASWASLQNLDENSFLQFLDTGIFPPPDLIIRTGWSPRHSGYFLYQSAYSEYYFTDILWPEFWKEDFDKALDFFQKIKRNFWK
jgi:undecaprenyl diphosphate synthase